MEVARIVPYLILMAAVLVLGLLAAMLGTIFELRALYYVGALTLVVGVMWKLVSSTNPANTLFAAVFLGLPVIATILPPGRFGVSAFDALTLLLVPALIYRYRAKHSQQPSAFFVSWHFWLAFIGLLVLTALSHFPSSSAWVWFEILGIYAFFRASIDALRAPDGFSTTTRWLAYVVIIMATGAIFERATGINLTLGGGNFNQVAILNGEVIRRAAGFFQDPQKSAQFFACSAAFFFVLLGRKRFESGATNGLIAGAFVLALVGLMISGSRVSMVALFLVIVAGSVFLLKISGVFRFVLLIGLATTAAILPLVPDTVWEAVLSTSWFSRFESFGASIDFRVKIWLDTWSMFSDQPLWGIGPGSFRDYLRLTNPSTAAFYGLGALAGIEYIPDQPESGYLKILYEGGIIGALCTLAIIVGSVRAGIRATTSADQLRRTELWAAFAGLAVFAVSFVSLFTVGDERNAAILAFLLALLWQDWGLAPNPQNPERTPRS